MKQLACNSGCPLASEWFNVEFAISRAVFNGGNAHAKCFGTNARYIQLTLLFIERSEGASETKCRLTFVTMGIYSMRIGPCPTVPGKLVGFLTRLSTARGTP